MGNPYETPCPYCEVPIGEHRSEEELTDHTLAWMSDPDREPFEMISIAYGVLQGIAMTIQTEGPGPALLRVQRQLKIWATALERMQRINKLQGGSHSS